MADSVLLLGNFLSGSTGVHGPSEILARLLAERGWQVSTASEKSSQASRLLDMVAAVWRGRRRYSLACVEVFSGPAFGWAEAVCLSLRLTRKPYVLALHGGNLPKFSRRFPRRVRALLRCAAAVTAPSTYLQSALKHLRPDIRLIPNPIEVAAYPFRPRTGPRPHLVWLRAFHDIYHPTLAVQVLARVKKDFPEARLTMMGPDKGDGSLAATRRLAQELGLSRHLTFPGQIPKLEVPAWLDRGDIFLNTANFDNAPVSLVEALAAGLCVVSTDVGGISHLARHETEALLTPPCDAGAMAAAVHRLLTEPGLAARLSHHARLRAQQCDLSTVLPQWEALLTQVIRSGQHA